MRSLFGTMAAAPPPDPSNGRITTGSGGDRDSNFDTNMVIILAALLCALICALGLNSIVRCALRCGRRLTLETSEAATVRLAATGLKKCALRQIPVAIFGSGTNIPATECPICLVEFVDGEKIRVLPSCNHGFHVQCVDTWLSSHSSCPTCRHSVLDSSVAAVCITVAGGSVGVRSPEVDGTVPMTAELVEVS
ncbi:RING-H2 finger protein ATL74-like [Phalaenopsis equestris]|uniref:RING-H2 finger protein ATL74-like n=1 Tax=Phalaenopsis equestris TaxID=78828 RepID=UPI0009E31DAC|nr:RING-H2 finger protein ATL74-like [Phalaenopsis equestris]XP_020595392.1 RING-H2 finger protein ATL74-like [Phalaenopsis equestris]XP_020595393.1 RING-H2 finger protein ATL74-like [Phalaenopsis equestris]